MILHSNALTGSLPTELGLLTALNDRIGMRISLLALFQLELGELSSLLDLSHNAIDRDNPN
jgi:hypothetical protein